MATKTPPELLEEMEPAPSTINELRAKAAKLQGEIDARDAAVVEAHREQLLADWDAARARTQDALDRFVLQRVHTLLEHPGRFDATGLADLVASLTPEFDAAMREQLAAMPAQTIANHVHPPNDDRMSQQLGQVTQEIAQLEEQERMAARLLHNPRNPTPILTEK